MATKTSRTVPTAIGVRTNMNPSSSIASGLIAAVIATAPAGGCNALHEIVAVMASPTDNAMRSKGSDTVKQTATATMAATVLPTIADQGCARGLLGTAKRRTELAPKGATRYKPRFRSMEDDRTKKPAIARPTKAPRPARAASIGDTLATAGPNEPSFDKNAPLRNTRQKSHLRTPKKVIFAYPHISAREVIVKIEVKLPEDRHRGLFQLGVKSYS